MYFPKKTPAFYFIFKVTNCLAYNILLHLRPCIAYMSACKHMRRCPILCMMQSTSRIYRLEIHVMKNQFKSVLTIGMKLLLIYNIDKLELSKRYTQNSSLQDIKNLEHKVILALCRHIVEIRRILNRGWLALYSYYGILGRQVQLSRFCPAISNTQRKIA